MLINETCYHGLGMERSSVTVAQALAIKAKTGRFTGECPECSGRISVYKASRLHAAHFQHQEPANEKCSMSKPYRPAQ
jgi:hypothetical protein